MKLIANELKYAEKCLRENIIDKKQGGKTIVVLIKYFNKYHNKTQEEIIQLLNEFLDNVGSSYDRGYLQDMVMTHVKANEELKCVEKVSITKNEMNIVMAMDTEAEQKLLFTMLVQYKIKNQLFPTNNKKATEEHGEIFKDARVVKNKQERRIILNKFHNNGIITLPVHDPSSKQIELNYVNEESPTVLEIESFDDFIMDYYKYVGKRVICCKRCGKRVIAKGKNNTSQKYCSPCKHILQLEQQRKSMEKSRSMVKK